MLAMSNARRRLGPGSTFAWELYDEIVRSCWWYGNIDAGKEPALVAADDR